MLCRAQRIIYLSPACGHSPRCLLVTKSNVFSPTAFAEVTPKVSSRNSMSSAALEYWILTVRGPLMIDPRAGARNGIGAVRDSGVTCHCSTANRLLLSSQDVRFTSMEDGPAVDPRYPLESQ